MISVPAAIRPLSHHPFTAPPWLCDGAPPDYPVIINDRVSLFPPLPAASFISLPPRDLEPARPAVAPCGAGCPARILLLAVEDHADAVVGLAIGGQGGVVDQEADIGPVRIAVIDGQQNRLVLRVRGTPGGVWQERVVAPGP